MGLSSASGDEPDTTAVVSGICAALTEVRDTDLIRYHDHDLLTLARTIETAARLVFAVQVHLAGELDTRKTSATFGATSSTALLRETLNISAGDARARVSTARAVLPQQAISGGHTPPALPLLAAAITAGTIGIEQARIIVTTMRKLPSTLPPDLRDDCQQVLVEQGHLTEPEPFARFARQVLLACDPDGNHDDRDPTEKVDLTIGPRNHDNGITPFRGHLDDDRVELLHQALKGLTNPHPTDTGTPDPRTPATRRGQALKEVLRRYLDIADTPTTGGERPHITLTMSYQDLKNALRHGTLDYGGPITPATARRLACDATVIPAVLGGPSEILDIGRATRTWPTAIRRAATLRDQGCAWPGCDRPPAWTDIHHIRHWANGGPTSLTNAVLLCRRHHHTIHDGHWHITLATDGTPEFTAPTWIDPTQTPRRNHHHHLPDHLRPDRN